MTDSIISEELRSRISGCRRTEKKEYLCEVDFSPSFRGFAGHFEGNPIVPGVCLIELVRVFAELVLEKKLKTCEISQCRFRSPLPAGATAQCKLMIRPCDDGGYRLQAEVRVGENTACQVRLRTEEL